MSESTPKAGKYELLCPWRQPIKGEKGAFEKRKKGDVVTLDAEQAERLVGGGAAVPEGTTARLAKERAQALADQAKERADEAAEAAKAATSDVRSAGRAAKDDDA